MYSFKSPAAYVQGRGVVTELGDRVAPLGSSALVIGDEVVLDIVGDRARTSLDDAPPPNQLDRAVPPPTKLR